MREFSDNAVFVPLYLIDGIFHVGDIFLFRPLSNLSSSIVAIDDLVQVLS